MLVSMAHAGSLPDALTNAGRCAGIQSTPVVKRWADLFTREVGESITNGTASPAAGAGLGAAIDSTQSEVGPIIQDHAQTVGQGSINFNVIASRSPLTEFDGKDLHHLHGIGKIVLKDERLQEILASELTYDIDARIAVIAPSVTYGVTNNFDLSLLLPIVAIGADVGGSNRVGARLSETVFIPFAGPVTVSGSVSNEVGFGDLSLRGKYKVDWWDNIITSLVLMATFPSGNPDKGFGTGDYWLKPSVTFEMPLWENAVQLNANLGFNVDLSNIKNSEAAYAAGISFRLIPGWASLAVEFLGRSELGLVPTTAETGVLYLHPDGSVVEDNFLGMEFTRHDYLDLGFGIRVRLPYHLMGFVAGTIPLNNDGLRADFTPVFGIGANF